MSEQSTIRWERDADGIVVLTLDDPNQSANTMNAATSRTGMETTIRRTAKASMEVVLLPTICGGRDRIRW